MLEQIFKELYQNWVNCNLETICAVPPHDLTVHQGHYVSMQSDENCRSYLETKSGCTDEWMDTRGYIIMVGNKNFNFWASNSWLEKWI